MATISARKRKYGTVYRAEVRITGHKTVSQTFTRKGDAENWAEETEHTLRTVGYLGDVPPGDLAIKTAIQRYLDEISPQKAILTTQRDHRSARPLLFFFSGQTLRSITTTMVKQFKDSRLEQKISPSSLQKELALLSHLYTVAREDWYYLDIKNPVTAVSRPKPVNRLRLLTEAEILRLLDACKKSRNPKLYHYVLVQLHTGMRPSEGAGLTWQQIDLDRRMIDLTKTKTEPRRVPLTYQAVEALAELVPEGDCDGSDYVFIPATVSTATRLRPNIYFRQAYEHALDRAGIKDFRMHDLRHTAASWLIMNGVDIRTLADILGHKTMTTVMKYTHFLDAHKLAAIDRIGHLGR